MSLDERATLILLDGRRIHVRMIHCDLHRCWRWEIGPVTRCGFDTAAIALENAKGAMVEYCASPCASVEDEHG